MIFYVIIRVLFDVEYGGEYREFYAVRTDKDIADKLLEEVEKKRFEDGYDYCQFIIEEHTEESFAILGE